jgi:DNA polymerase-3 subunit epsilon
MERQLTACTFCAVDVETTGLFLASRLVEIGAVKFNRGGILEEFQTLVDPQEPINPQAISIHGITNEMVAGSPAPHEAVARLLHFMDDAVFIAHNARFDKRVIGMECARAGIATPDNPVLDTVLLARRLFRGLHNYRLDTLCDYLGVTRERIHRGLPDALAAMEIFQRYLEEAPQDACLSDVPGYIGNFSELAPKIEVSLSGDQSDFQVLAEKKVMIEMIYQGGTDPGVPRMITPISVRSSGLNEYIIAYCHRTGRVKTFRLDRVELYRLP